MARWPQVDSGAEGVDPTGADCLGNPQPAGRRAHWLHGPAGMQLQVRADPKSIVQVLGYPALMSELARGALSKMAAQLDAPVQYSFRLGDDLLPVNPLIGKSLRLEFLGAIHCTHCGRKTK